MSAFTITTTLYDGNGVPTLTTPITGIASATLSTSASSVAGTSIISDSQSSISSISISTPFLSSASTSTSNGASTTSIVSSTALTTSSAAPSPSHNGISGGAAAGIAIGCIIAGLAIGVVAAFLFLRRRGQPKGPQPEYVPMQYSTRAYNSKGLPATPEYADTIQLSQFLLAPKPEKEIAGELQALGHLVQQHVENNYHQHQIQPNTSALAQALADLGFGRNAGQVASLAVSPATRYAALQHVISNVILGSAVFSPDTRPSLLGGSVSSFSREVPPVERHRGNAQAVSLAFTRWRQISAFLLNPNRSERTAIVPQESALVDPAKELVAGLNKFLAPFIDERASYQQKSHLQDVVIECAKFGYILFSQPEEYRLNFGTGRGQHEIATHPGLDKVGDENGAPYNPPQSVLKPIFERF